VFVENGVGKTAMAEGRPSCSTRIKSRPGVLSGAEVFALDTGALLAGTLRGD
jgi:ATP-dependent Clp protease ATP-binding subunit ClpA